MDLLGTYIQPIYLIRNLLICLTLLACMGGVFVYINRQQYNVAVLFVLGLALFGLEPLADFLVWQILVVSELDFELLDYLYVGLSSLGMIGGALCLTAALFLSTQEPKTDEDDIFDSF